MKLAIHADMDVKASALALMAVFMISAGLPSSVISPNLYTKVNHDSLDP